MFDRERFIKDLCYLAERGVPWRHNTCDPDIGMDCINIARWAYNNQGLTLPSEIEQEFKAYSMEPDGWRMMEIMRKWFEEVPEDKAQPADLLQIFARKNPKHMAVLVAENEVVEAYRSEDGHVRRVLKQPLDPRRRIAAVFRIPDFA